MAKQEVIKKNTHQTDYSDHDKSAKKNWVKNVMIQNKTKDSNENRSSVITKSTKPKVIIQSENVNNCSLYHKHIMIKFIFLIVISSIILVTFFLSLRTYNMVKELSILFN